MSDKPTILYHGSSAGIEGPLSPRPQHGDCNGAFPDGPRDLVFATHDKLMVSLYALKNDYMLGVGNPEMQGGVYSATFQHHDAWRAEIDSSACNIYHLPADSFTNTVSTHTGTASGEWLSTETVHPVHSERETPESVMAKGGQLFFLDAALDKSVWHGEKGKPVEDAFLSRLNEKDDAGLLPKDFNPLALNHALMKAGLMTHLNAETGISPVALPEDPKLEAAIAEDIQWLKEIQTLSKAGLSAKDIPELQAAKRTLNGSGCGADGGPQTPPPPTPSDGKQKPDTPQL